MERYEPFRMLEFTLFKELNEFVEVVPYFIHQLLAQGTSFSDDWIFPDHFHPSISSSGVHTIGGSNPASRQSALTDCSTNPFAM